jgi:hypothetical protein
VSRSIRPLGCDQFLIIPAFPAQRPIHSLRQSAPAAPSPSRRPVFRLDFRVADRSDCCRHRLVQKCTALRGLARAGAATVFHRREDPAWSDHQTGNREIRRLLVLGATSMVYRAPQRNSVVGCSAAEDLVQEVAMKVLVACDSYAPGTNFRPGSTALWSTSSSATCGGNANATISIKFPR